CVPPDVSAAKCGVFSASTLSASCSRYHRPSRPIPIGTISYRFGSIADITVSAERSEISCSPDRPPKSTPPLILFFSAIPHLFFLISKVQGLPLPKEK